jgi:hypothetical protein
LTGTLPVQWSTLIGLTQLNMAYNSLTGTIPSAWASDSGMKVNACTLLLPVSTQR